MTTPTQSGLFNDLSVILETMKFIETFSVDHVFYLGYPQTMYGPIESEATIYDMYMREIRRKYDYHRNREDQR